MRKLERLSLNGFEGTLSLNPEDVNRTRVLDHEVPQTAAEEERLRRKQAWEAKQVRQIYEEMVLRKPKPESELVQIGNGQ